MLDLTNELPPVWPPDLEPVGHNTFDKEPFEQWWDRVKPLLSHLPSELCEQWIYKYWHSAKFSFLEIAQITVDERSMTTTEVLGELHREYAPKIDPEHTYKTFQKLPDGSKFHTAAVIDSMGTWDYPVITLSTPNGIVSRSGGDANTRLVLVEGHQRHRYLYSIFHLGKAPPGPHRVFVLTTPQVS